MESEAECRYLDGGVQTPFEGIVNSLTQGIVPEAIGRRFWQEAEVDRPSR